MALVRRSAVSIGTSVLVVRVLRREFQVARVLGGSMSPTFRHGDLVLARRRFRAVPRGSVVIFEPYEASASLARPEFRLSHRIKRVIAVAGERAPRWLVEAQGLTPVVPTGCVALDGDAERSESSAQFGYIPVGRIESIVIRRLTRANREGSGTSEGMT
jgi:signal peptidase I